MWPWEHALFAYVFYSIFSRLVFGEPPNGPSTFVLVFASMLPDLVDKPLAWQYDIFAGGYGPTHSILVAIPVSLAVYTIARRRGFSRVGSAFAIGYPLHLVGDILPASIVRGDLYIQHMLWPIGTHVPSDDHGSFVGGVSYYLAGYVETILAFEPTAVLVLQLGSAIAGLSLWIVDGRPGIVEIVAVFGYLGARMQQVARRIIP